MAREYIKVDALSLLTLRRKNIFVFSLSFALAGLLLSAILPGLTPFGLFVFGGFVPLVSFLALGATLSHYHWLEGERKKESQRRGDKPVLGLPPDRKAFEKGVAKARSEGKVMIDRYLVGFEVDSGEAIWVTDDEICSHGAVFAKTGVGKTLWLEGLMFQQMARGRASGFTFIDAKRDPATLADIIMMALLTGRIEDLVVVDPFDPVCSYNFVFTTQRADVKARKILRCGLPPTSDQSTTKHYDRLAADAVYRVVRAMESLGLAWSVRDIAVALSAFTVAYPRLRSLLNEQGEKQAMVELGHLAGSYRTAKGSLDAARLTDNLRGIASELHSISNSEAGEMFCAPRADLSLTDAILRGKLIYYMLPRLEEAESAARMVKVFREDLEVSIGEITSNRNYHLEDPHMVIIDEGASTFGPTWANLFELARKGRFSLLFGAQSIGGLMDTSMGLSEQFYQRVIANVNLKVIMRIGDNKTADDMSTWIGTIKTKKKSISTGTGSSISGRELTKSLEFNRRSADSLKEGVTISEDEEELVSAEELKHEMYAEKGLAWFDKGDGRLRKGRSIWFHTDLPGTWEGREFLTRYESVEADEIGLAEWVDEHILSQETAAEFDELKPKPAPGAPPPNGDNQAASNPNQTSSPKAAQAEDPDAGDGKFRLNLFKGFRGKPRSRTFVSDKPEEKVEEKKEEATKSAEDKTEKKPETKPSTLSFKEDKVEAKKEEAIKEEDNTKDQAILNSSDTENSEKPKKKKRRRRRKKKPGNQNKPKDAEQGLKLKDEASSKPSTEAKIDDDKLFIKGSDKDTITRTIH